MHVTIPNFVDPTDRSAPPITAIGKIDYVGVGVQDGSGRLSILVFKSLDSYNSTPRSDPLTKEPVVYTAGDGVIPPLYPSEGVPGLVSDPEFAAAWALVGKKLLDCVAAHVGGEVVTP